MTNPDFDTWLLDPGRRALVMGILNVTPDSFSDGGRYAAVDAAVEHAREMCAAGAELIDIGGESTRPGSQPVDAAEQIRRVAPVIERLAGGIPAVLSIDTTRAEVARRAVEAGAYLVNDVSGGAQDAAMLPTVASLSTPIVLMHMQGTPATMQDRPQYQDVVKEIGGYLAARVAAAVAAGIPAGRVILDPGIGFGKTLEHNLALLRSIRRLSELGHPLLIGTSRKGFIGRITGEADPDQRLMGTAATVAWSIANGGAVVRVHDVAAMVKVVRMIQAILGEAAPS